MYELFCKGGVVMWPLLGLSILASALAMYHFYLTAQTRKQELQPVLFEKIQRGIDNIFLIGSIAPLFGLLGTVLGIIDCFSALSAGRPDQQVLSSGLSEALLTTAAGLILSIPCQIAGHLLQQRLDKSMAQCRRAGE
ncbi:MAG: MotA/TolQ/ExbB proton channel family protein [Mailhella sp.]|nr:MotA/TolQ/ExbB proton channel family protein [Mailhella sp.]